MMRLSLVILSVLDFGRAIVQPPFHRHCAALNELGSCHHYRGPLVTQDVHLAAHQPLIGPLAGLLHPFQHPYSQLHVDGRKAHQLDDRHFLDMFLHETDEGAVSPLDIPLDRSYTHHPNRWEWN